MSRKERRAAHGQLQKAAEHFRRAIAAKPDNAQAYNDLACVLVEQGRLEDAAVQFRRALTLVPELLEQSAAVVETLVKVNPLVGEGMARMAAAGPSLPAAETVLGIKGLAGVARDPLLRCVLESAPVRDVNLERLLTSIRRHILRRAADMLSSKHADENILGFACALAKQCFINEYAFAITPEEKEQFERLKDILAEALTSGGPVSALLPAAVATYVPLYALPDASLLLDRPWPTAVRGVLAQQVIEPREELQEREAIPRLTPIENSVSLLVQQQYEENPYPRWVTCASDRGAMTIEQYLRQQFPHAPVHAPDHGKRSDILIAGCGTGQQSIVTARRFAAASVLAIDLSLASICYAKRMTRAFGVRNIEYAQADILNLGSTGRTFDIIESSGVLHHLADPMEGWRVLLSMLRPGGFMHVGLYSHAARAQVRAARAFVAEQGYQVTAEDIRRCRQELLNTSMRSLARYSDYFSISECRDLLFHVQEHHLTIPDIRAFISEHGCEFIGFELDPQTLESYRFRFPDDRSMTNLDHWHEFETAKPDTFVNMYQFWIQKS